MHSPPIRHAFEALDGLRGVAAFAVVVYHAHDLLGATQPLPRAYLAVDLFFLLSGFVLAHAYQRRLAAGLSTSEFMRLRFERLYPAYALGLAIAFVGIAVAMRQGSTILASGSALLNSLSFGALLLPVPSLLSGKAALYPLNPAAWSIFFELLANAAFAATFVLLRGPLLAALAGLGAAFLVVQALLNGSLDAGSEWASFGGGAARVVFSFFVGVALHRLHDRGTGVVTAPWWLCFGLVVATFAVPAELAGGAAYELACVLVLYPLAIMATANVPATPRRSAAFGLLGAWSYPLYILHTPLLFVLTGSMVRLVGLPVAAMRPWGGIAVIAVIVLCVAVAERIYERPVLKFLRSRRRGVAVAAPVVGAVEPEAR